MLHFFLPFILWIFYFIWQEHQASKTALTFIVDKTNFPLSFLNITLCHQDKFILFFKKETKHVATLLKTKYCILEFYFSIDLKVLLSNYYFSTVYIYIYSISLLSVVKAHRMTALKKLEASDKMLTKIIFYFKNLNALLRKVIQKQKAGL